MCVCVCACVCAGTPVYSLIRSIVQQPILCFSLLFCLFCLLSLFLLFGAVVVLLLFVLGGVYVCVCVFLCVWGGGGLGGVFGCCLLLVLFYCLLLGFLFVFLVCTEFDAGVAVVLSFFLLYAFAFL